MSLIRQIRAAIRGARARRHEAKLARRTEQARARRRENHMTTYIGVTGSYGKTTATALLGKILETAGSTFTRSHHNIFPSVVDTLLTVSRDAYRFCVQEVGATAPGSVREMRDLLMPQVAIVTGIGMDHRKAFRTLEATAAEKASLVEAVPADGLAVLNADDPLVVGMAAGCRGRVVYYGRAEDADLRLLSASARWPAGLVIEVVYRGERFSVQTRLIGAHWATSVLAALLAALVLGVPRAKALEAIGAFEPPFNRMSVHRTPVGSWHVADASKGSFSGVAACLAFLDDVQAARKTVVFGTLADYPGASRAHYYKVARLIMAKADRAFFVGQSAQRVRRLAEGEFKGRLFVIDDIRQAADTIARDSIADEIVYVKSSAADHLERITLKQLAPIKCWTERCGKPRNCLTCRHLFGTRPQFLFKPDRRLLARPDRGN